MMEHQKNAEEHEVEHGKNEMNSVPAYRCWGQGVGLEEVHR